MIKEANSLYDDICGNMWRFDWESKSTIERYPLTLNINK